MYSGGSVKETLAFIDGYRFGNATPISGKIFDKYVCIRHSFPDNYIWTHVINTCAKDENDAMKMVEETITEFIRLKETMSEEELLQYITQQLTDESEPEKIFREFNKALFLGDESLIRQFIDEHQDAHILWKEKYPEEVALQLINMSLGQPIRSILIPGDEKKLNIISAGWSFPIEMNLKEGKWKINAEKIIQLRMDTKAK
jgi:hypothetical protein